MKVKVGDVITSSEHEPVMVILSEGDKEIVLQFLNDITIIVYYN